MSFRQTINNTLICERTVAELTLQLTDQKDVELPLGQLTSLTLTLYVGSRGTNQNAILNSRNDQSILNANGGTVSSTGLLTLILSKEDNSLSTQQRGFETHVALIRWTWAAGVRPGAKEISFTVANQSKMG